MKVGEHNLFRGEMRDSYIVFRVRVQQGGKFVFWDDDGSIIRRKGKVIHEDRSAHAFRATKLELDAGDELEIAQWQHVGQWLWGAEARVPSTAHNGDALNPYVPLVQRRLGGANGPPLKVFTNGRHPLRVVTSIYSLVLRGYSPSAVFLFGEVQWVDAARAFFERFLPFAHIVRDADFRNRIRQIGGHALEELACRYWWVMKTAVALFHPPNEFCMMDDDVFILDDLKEALEAFERCDLVYEPDEDHTSSYRRSWGWMLIGKPLPTGRFNAGLYWMRTTNNPHNTPGLCLRVHPRTASAWEWEQGFIAALYASRAVRELPARRFFYPLVDGIPGGLLGYDYNENPSGFASVHFGGLSTKPDDPVMRHMVSEVLGAPSRYGGDGPEPSLP
jgi:hypothetical protein